MNKAGNVINDVLGKPEITVQLDPASRSHSSRVGSVEKGRLAAARQNHAILRLRGFKKYIKIKSRLDIFLGTQDFGSTYKMTSQSRDLTSYLPAEKGYLPLWLLLVRKS